MNNYNFWYSVEQHYACQYFSQTRLTPQSISQVNNSQGRQHTIPCNTPLIYWLVWDNAFRVHTSKGGYVRIFEGRRNSNKCMRQYKSDDERNLTLLDTQWEVEEDQEESIQ